MTWPPKSGEDLPPPLTEDSEALIFTGITGIARLYERALRRIALTTDEEGEPSESAQIAYDTLLGKLI